MRPVTRGDTPKDADDNEIQFSDYKNARDPLIERIGDYCSYCEIALPSKIDVEHVLPKDENPGLERTWSNFLLSCGNCNSIKGSDDLDLADYYWPERDNTSRAFVYEQDKAPRVANAPEVDAEKAKRTLKLTGIDRLPGHPRYSRRDRRWKKRFQAWTKAIKVAALLNTLDTEEMRTLAVEIAVARGFWSVWMAVFSDDQDMRRRLINAFRGAAMDCFDDATNPVPRPGGAV